jgi:DNA polymerase elongation subunit (family B)
MENKICLLISDYLQDKDFYCLYPKEYEDDIVFCTSKEVEKVKKQFVFKEELFMKDKIDFEKDRKSIEDKVFKYYITQCTNTNSQIVVKYDFFGRKVKKINYRDYFYIADDNGEFKSFDGKKVKKLFKDEVFYKDFSNTYEADVYSNIRWLIDSGARFIKKQKIGYFDIETDRSLDIFGTPKPIVSLSLVDNNKRKFVWAWRKDLKNERKIVEDSNWLLFDSENEMLLDFFDFLKKESFDVLVGWNSDRFDWPYLLNRAKNYFNIESDRLSSFGKTSFKVGDNKDSVRVRIYGTDIIDLLKVYKKITYDKKPSIFSLDNIAKITLGEGKKDVGNISKAWRENLDLLLKYNIHDCELTRRIDEKNRLLDYMMTLQEISSCPLDLCLWNKNVVDSYLLKEYHGKIVFPTAKNNDREDIVGAITGKILFNQDGDFKSVDPDKGFFKNVVVIDFSSMYPSIFRTFNVSPDTLEFKGDIEINGVGFTTKKRGLIPNVFEELLKKRREYENLRDSFDRSSADWYVYQNYQGGVKQIANSFYGITGYPKFRLYNPAITRTITFIGQQLIAFTWKKAEELGYNVLYSDTDSIFVELPDKERKEVIEEAKKLENELNDSFVEFVKQFKDTEDHFFKVDCEKIFSKLIMVGVKKKYIGRLFYKKGEFTDELFYRGIELVKRDTPKLFKVFLQELCEKLLAEDDSVQKYVKEFKLHCKENFVIRDLLVYKNISKRLEDYVKTSPQHVKAARFSNKNLGKNFDKGDTIGLIHVKSKQTDCVGLEDDDKSMPEGFNINWDKYFELFVDGKVEMFEFLPQLKTQQTMFDFIGGENK